MLDSFLSGENVNFFVAFVAGFVTFFASCLLPLVPTYLAYLSGISLSSEDAGKKRFEIFKSALLFVAGFVLTFVLMSLFISKITTVFSSFREVIEKISGIIFIILGLFVLGVFKHKLFSQERKLDLRLLFSKNKKIDFNELFTKYKNVHAVLTGVAFGFGWTPCIGPVLAVILFWASRSGSTLTGILLLFSYGIGLGVPFLIVALAFEKVVPLLKKYARISQYVSYFSGVIILLVGLLMFIGQFEQLSILIVRLIGLNEFSF